MSTTNNQTSDDLTQRYQELLATQQTLLLATASAQGIPDISYAPFVRDHAGTFYIYVSEMTNHTVNLLSNPHASVLFIRSESKSRNLFARERAMINCWAQQISKDDELYTAILQTLYDKFGEVINVLRSLPDFHLFALHPENGRYVVGFGRAFAIQEDTIKTPIGSS